MPLSTSTYSDTSVRRDAHPDATYVYQKGGADDEDKTFRLKSRVFGILIDLPLLRSAHLTNFTPQNFKGGRISVGRSII